MNLFHKQEAMHLIRMVGLHRDMVSWAFNGKKQNRGETEEKKVKKKTTQINLYRQNQ